MKNPFIFAIPFAILACSPINNETPIEDSQLSKGQIIMPLTSQGTSGTFYQLQLPSVTLEGAESTLELSFDTHDEFNVSLQEGDYNLSIQDWTLYRLEDGDLIPVEAELLSENPQSVTIYTGETTHTVIRFKTSNEVLSFDNGDLSVHLEVEEEEPETAAPVECGEKIYSESIQFTDQEEFFQFTTEYGAVQGGTLTLEGAGIVDASALSCLSSTAITIENTLIEDLRVAEQESMHQLNVINNPQLSVISIPINELSHLKVEGNEQLTALQTDQTIGYGIIVQDNPALQEINIASVEEIIGDLYIENNDSLDQFDAFALEYVGNRIRIVENPLPQLMFPSLERTGGYVLIKDNTSLQHIVMPKVFVIGEPTNTASVTADLLIQDNDSLMSVDFSSLFFISRKLTISDNPQLTSLDGFADLTSIQDLTIQGNARLNDILGLSTLAELSNVGISFNPHLPEAMIDYLIEAEIGTSAVNGDINLSNNSSISMESYDMSACNAEYLAVGSGEFFPIASILQMSFATSEECPVEQEFSDGTRWKINGNCLCN